jgi:hypothetical protein
MLLEGMANQSPPRKTETQLQVLCLAKPFFFLWLFPKFTFLLLNSADKLAWGEHVLDFGRVP